MVKSLPPPLLNAKLRLAMTRLSSSSQVFLVSLRQGRDMLNLLAIFFITLLCVPYCIVGYRPYDTVIPVLTVVTHKRKAEVDDFHTCIMYSR